MTEKVIECVYEYKTKMALECKDMESDLVQFYSDVTLMMSQIYPVEDFGPEKKPHWKELKTWNPLNILH